jgi:hypothetical protein
MRAVLKCALILMILSSPACHNMKVVSVNQTTGWSSVSLTLSDQSVVVVDGPQTYGNKLVGFVKGRYREFSIANVKEVRVRQTNGARTAALVIAGAVGFVGFAYVITGAGDSNRSGYCDAPEHVDEPICQGQ